MVSGAASPKRESDAEPIVRDGRLLLVPGVGLSESTERRQTERAVVEGGIASLAR